jgi:hypothetical protein
MRLVRVVLAVLAALVAGPALAAGTVLLAAHGQLAADGTLAAWTVPVHTSGYAVVVPDLDALLRHDLPFARAGRTSVRVSVAQGGAPVFIGLAPRAAVAGYLDRVAHSEITAVGLARGSALPLVLSDVAGSLAPRARPDGQSFWLTSSNGGTLHWAAGLIRGREVSLVLMTADGSRGVAIALHGAIRPGWLVPTAWAMVGLGVVGMTASVLLVLGLARPLPPARGGAGQPARPDDTAAGGAVTRPPADPLALPPPYRPASAGRVWACAMVRAGTLAEMMAGGRTTEPAAAWLRPAGPRPDAAPQPPAVIAPVWSDAPAPWPPLSPEQENLSWTRIPAVRAAPGTTSPTGRHAADQPAAGPASAPGTTPAGRPAGPTPGRPTVGNATSAEGATRRAAIAQRTGDDGVSDGGAADHGTAGHDAAGGAAAGREAAGHDAAADAPGQGTVGHGAAADAPGQGTGGHGAAADAPGQGTVGHGAAADVAGQGTAGHGEAADPAGHGAVEDSAVEPGPDATAQRFAGAATDAVAGWPPDAGPDSDLGEDSDLEDQTVMPPDAAGLGRNRLPLLPTQPVAPVD